MKILHIDTQRRWRGGEQQLLFLAEGLQKRGHHQVIACQPESALFERGVALQNQIVTIPMRGEWDIVAIWRLRNIIDTEKIQIVHCHCAHAHTLGLIAAKISKVQPKVVVSRRVDFHIHKNPVSWLKYHRGADIIIAISHSIKWVLIEDGIEPIKIEVVYSGIDLKKFDGNVINGEYLYQELGLMRGIPIIGIVAALAPHKDHKTFLQAAALVKGKMPDAQFLIVGEGELRGELERMVERLGLKQNVTFAGFRTDIASIFSVLTILVSSSYLEGLGTTLLDAQSFGIPAVATNTGGIPEIIENEINGLLVPPQNPWDLSEAIIRLLVDTKLRGRIITMAKEMVCRFSKDAMIEGTEHIYIKVAQASCL